MINDLKQVNAEIITIGDEILYGQTLDTNSHWLSGKLDAIGVRTIRKTTVADDENDILQAFAAAENRADIILITGGLGPTSDDLTKPCLVNYFDTTLVLHDEALQEITALFQSKGRKMTASNRDQALLPAVCKKITNPMGTAPGMWFEKKGKVFVSMPGVPYEMKAMVAKSILPMLKEKFQLPFIHHRIIRTIGIGESWIAEIIKDWVANLPSHIKLAYLPSIGQVKLRLTIMGSDKELLTKEVEKYVSSLLPLIAPYVYGFDADVIEQTVGDQLRQLGHTIAVAESCSGGYLSHMITSVPGSSDYYKGGICSYANEIKTSELGVSKEILESHGAVSEETACQMAKAIRLKMKTTYGLATTGIAGPGGGSEEKPVGTVWIALADSESVKAYRLSLGRERNINIQLSAMQCLHILHQHLKKTFFHQNE